MRRGLLSIVTVLAMLSAEGQSPSLSVRYRLHAEKEHYSSNSPSTILALTPDQALLVLIPQTNSQWLFKRLTGWNTNTPKEESLSLKGSSKEEGASGYEDLKVDPSGRYAVIRVRSLSGGIDAPNRSRSAFVVVVDLHGFTVASQQTTTDLLLADSNWAFADNGLLIASVLTGRVTTPEKPKNFYSYDTLEDTYQAAALSLPEFQKSMPCQYTLFLDNRLTRTRSDRYLSKADSGCAALVALAQVPSAENLPNGPPKPTPHATLAGPTCMFGGDSPSAEYALYGCSTGHEYLDGMVVTTSTRNLTVLSVAASRAILMVPLPHNTHPYPAVLAMADDHTWLLILRDGTAFEAYRLP